MNYQLKHCGIVAGEIAGVLEWKIRRFDPLIPDNGYVELSLTEHRGIRNGVTKRASILVDIPSRHLLKFSASGQTFIEAVDRVLNKLEAKIGRQQLKKSNRHREKSLRDPLT